jgi:hypothetical protein
LSLIACFERAEELLAERPLRDTISEAEVKLTADRHYLSGFRATLGIAVRVPTGGTRMVVSRFL